MKRYGLLKKLVAIAVIATIIKFWVNAFVFDNGVAWNDPSPSILFSKFSGLFICPVNASPNELDWKGTKVSVNNVWIEREVKTEFSYVWLYTPKYSGKYLLCFTVDQGKAAFGKLRGPFFIVDGVTDRGVVSNGGNIFIGNLFSCELSPNDFSKRNTGISLVESWTDSRNHHSEFTW